MKLRNDYLRLRMLAIPLSGLIFSLSSLLPGLDINPALEPEGFARAAETVAIANLVGLVGIVILLFGFQGLYGYMSDTAIGRWAFVGMVSSTAGMGLFLPFIGIFAFAAPVAGRLYLDGDREAMSVVVESTSPSSFSALLFGGFFDSTIRSRLGHLGRLHMAQREASQMVKHPLRNRITANHHPFLQLCGRASRKRTATD